MADLKEFRSKTAKFANLGNSVGGRSDVVFLPIPGIYATRRLWVCSAAIIGLVSTRSYSSVLPLQDCLVICHLRFHPDMSCKLSYCFYSPIVLSLVSRKTPMISPTDHFFPYVSRRPPKIFSSLRRKREIEKVQNFLQIQSTLTHRRPKRCRRHQG